MSSQFERQLQDNIFRYCWWKGDYRLTQNKLNIPKISEKKKRYSYFIDLNLSNKYSTNNNELFVELCQYFSHFSVFCDKSRLKTVSQYLILPTYSSKSYFRFPVKSIVVELTVIYTRTHDSIYSVYRNTG